MTKKPLLLSSVKVEKILDKKKAIRMCVKKMKRIADPESKLCKAVLINNTLQLLKKSEGIKLQSDSKPDCIEMDHFKGVSNSETPSKYSPEDILSEIVLPPPLLPQLDHFTYRNLTNCIEPASDLLVEGFDVEKNFTTNDTFSDKGYISGFNSSNRTSVKYKHRPLSKCDFISDDSRTHFLGPGDAEPPADITLEEIDSNSGLFSDYSLYNSFNNNESAQKLESLNNNESGFNLNQIVNVGDRQH